MPLEDCTYMQAPFVKVNATVPRAAAAAEFSKHYIEVSV